MLLISCGGSSDDTGNTDQSILNGFWKSNCELVDGEYLLEYSHFIDGVFTSNYEAYSDFECSTDALRCFTISGAYTIGSELTTDSGVIADEIDVTAAYQGDVLSFLDIVSISSGTMYLGFIIEEGDRPTSLDFNYYLDSQIEGHSCSVGSVGGLVTYLKFDEPFGAELIDASSNGNDGILYGENRVVGKIGKAVSFGVNDVHAELYNPILNEGIMSIEAWIKPLELNENINYRIIGGYDYHGYALQISNNKLELLMDGNSFLIGASIIVTGEWTHVAFTSNGTNMKLFVNGVEDASSVSFFAPTNNTYGVNIGANKIYQNISGNLIHYIDEFIGIIDEVRIWNVGLSDSAVISYYEKTK